jgi:hypothetical protein
MGPITFFDLLSAARKPHIEAMERDIKHLLALADRYCQETNRSRARVATIILNHSPFFARLEAGGDCRTRTYDKVHAWLVKHLAEECGVSAATED